MRYGLFFFCSHYLGLSVSIACNHMTSPPFAFVQITGNTILAYFFQPRSKMFHPLIFEYSWFCHFATSQSPHITSTSQLCNSCNQKGHGFPLSMSCATSLRGCTSARKHDNNTYATKCQCNHVPRQPYATSNSDDVTKCYGNHVPIQQ